MIWSLGGVMNLKLEMVSVLRWCVGFSRSDAA